MASFEGPTAIGRLRIETNAATNTISQLHAQRVNLPSQSLLLLDEDTDSTFKPSAVGWEAAVPLKELHSILARDRANHHPVTTTISSSSKLAAAVKSKDKISLAKTRSGQGAGAEGAGETQTAAPAITPTISSSEINWQELVDRASLSSLYTSGRSSPYPHTSRHIQSHLVLTSSRRGTMGTNLYMPMYKPETGWTSPFMGYEVHLPQRLVASGSNGVANNQGPSRSRDRDRRLSLIVPSNNMKRVNSGNSTRQEQQVEVDDEASATGGGRYPTRTRKTAAQSMDVDEEAQAEPVGQKKASSGGRKVAKGSKVGSAPKTAAAAKAGKETAASPAPPSAAAVSGKRKRAHAPKISVQGPEDEHASEDEGGRATRASKRRKVAESPLTTSPSAVQMPPPAMIPSKSADALAGHDGRESSAPLQKTRSTRGRASGAEHTVEKASAGPSTRSLRAAARGRSGAPSSPPQEAHTDDTAGIPDMDTAQDSLPAYSTRRSARTSDGSANSDDKDGKTGTSPSVQSDETAVDRQAEKPKKVGFEGGQHVVSTLVDIVV
ncbi:hypothetical protein FRB97_007959 [Tulasnella sp. 331]|nr:hypothetical protein FRB97_007959 [Tulasnella sp. 331]